MKAFTEDEIKEVYSAPETFFEADVTREVVVLKKDKVEKVSKAGKDYTQVEWTLADAKTGEVHVEKFGFALTNSFRDFAEEMNLETSVYRITPVKTGERLHNGNTYPILEFEVEYVGEDGKAPATETAEQPEF